LNSSFDFRFTEDNEFEQKKTHAEINNKRNAKCHVIRLKGMKTQVQVLGTQDVFETDIIHYQPKQSIAASTCCIPEGLHIHDSTERRIKKIDDRY
jgi:hypothetical protein